MIISFQILEELNLTMDQFIDLCILSGCDYCDSIRGTQDFSFALLSLFKIWAEVYFLVELTVQ